MTALITGTVNLLCVSIIPIRHAYGIWEWKR